MTEDAAAAARVYAEKAEGGYTFYILDGTTKKYLDTYFNADNKVSLQFSADSTCVYSYIESSKAWATNVNGTDYYFGTYSNFNTMSASKTSYINADNTGVSQFPGFFEKAEAGETPEPPVHEHVFVEGKCECGAEDPNYVAPETSSVETLTMTATGGTLASDSLTISWETESISFVVAKASSSTAIRTSDADHFRVYAGNTFDITGKNGEKMTQVVITCTSSSYAEACLAALKTAGVTATVSGAVVTITSETGVEAINFAEGKQFRVKAIEVTFLA